MVTLGPDGTHFYVQVEDRVHSIAPDGTVETVAHLPAKGGRTQQLIVDPAGALVGTTTKGGARGVGSVFRIEGY